jgi:hypothetical protein
MRSNSSLHEWDGKSPARSGDVIGLLLDLDARNGGSLTVFKNGSLLGVAATVRSIQHLVAAAAAAAAATAARSAR